MPALVQITPHYPPTREGVGGYAAALAAGLLATGIESEFVVGDPAWASDGDASRWPVAGLRRRSAEEVVARLSAGGTSTVLLHYANYGFARRGCPRWLVDGLAAWRGGDRARRLVTFFHEVYASGPPWTSSFWLHPAQRRLARRLARLSDGLLTSLELYARLLRALAPGARARVLPMLSTVGEPERVAPLRDRAPRRMVVFGGAGVRRRAYGEHRGLLGAACAELEIRSLVDVGPPFAGLPARVAGVPVEALGVLAAARASRLLEESFAGFLAYPPAFLGKSTIFAAYCAHGALPVCAWPASGPAAEPPRFSAGGGGAPLAQLEAVAGSAFAWYRAHDLRRHVVEVRELLAPAAA